MKILENKFPLGSFPGQKTPGLYVDDFLHANVDGLAKAMKKDMSFLSVLSSSTLEVGTGKSTIAQQICTDYTDCINKRLGLNLEFGIKNIVFKGEDLITRAFELPRYSALILDEGDDLDQHYYSEVALTMRKFFRKCRQLNLFIIVILPNFFQFPKPYAISRSVFFMDIKFEGEFERGHFKFYSFNKKKSLYIMGKKYEDYNVVKPDFSGTFSDGYTVNEEEYRRAKLQDTIDDNAKDKKKKEDKKIDITKHPDTLKLLSNRMKQSFPHVWKLYSEHKITFQDVENIMGLGRTTIYEWSRELKIGGMIDYDNPTRATNTLYLGDKGENDGTEGAAGLDSRPKYTEVYQGIPANTIADDLEGQTK